MSAAAPVTTSPGASTARAAAAFTVASTVAHFLLPVAKQATVPSGSPLFLPSAVALADTRLAASLPTLARPMREAATPPRPGPGRRISVGLGAGIGSSGLGRSGQTEPIRVVVRLRPLREDLVGGAANACNEAAESGGAKNHGAWRVEQIGEQHWVSLIPGIPRVPLSPHNSGSGSSPPGSSGSLASSMAGPAGSIGARPVHERARFCFDACFDGRALNSEVFEAAAKDVVRSSLDGINATVLAYGQTNSGKTHSILGTLRQPGILPLAMHDLFTDGGGSRVAGVLTRVSYFEIFNERVMDLLAGPPRDGVHLPVKEDIDKGFFVQGLCEHPVHSARDVLRLVERGEERRRYAQTRWNEYSSRSHVLFTLTLERLPSHGPTRGRDAAPPGSGAGEGDSAATALPSTSSCGIAPGQSVKVNIVDLAGCENHKFEPSEDGRYINRSLFFLGEVISRLCQQPSNGRSASAHGSSVRVRSKDGIPSGTTPQLRRTANGDGNSMPGTPVRRGREPMARGSREGECSGGTPASASGAGGGSSTRSPSRGRERTDFIPYRDSKLTRILRASLGGNAVTLLLVTIHPAMQFVEQSMTSLRFATKARSIENYVSFGNEAPLITDEQNMIDKQQKIIEGLQNKLRELESRQAAQASRSPPSDARELAELRRQFEMEVRRGHGGDRDGSSPSAATDGIFRGMAESGLLDPWMLEQFRGLRHELEEKEQQLAAKTKLLSERERQLGQLREQLVGRGATPTPLSVPPDPLASAHGGALAWASTVASGSGAASPQPRSEQERHFHGGTLAAVAGGAPPAIALSAPAATPRNGASMKQVPGGDPGGGARGGGCHSNTVQTAAALPRYGPPDEGGGLPVVDFGGRVVAPPCQQGTSTSWVDVAASGAAPPNQQGTSPSWVDVAAAGVVHAQVQSRAEDIACLRSQRYVARQQHPVNAPAVLSSLPPATPSVGVTNGLPIGAGAPRGSKGEGSGCAGGGGGEAGSKPVLLPSSHAAHCGAGGAVPALTSKSGSRRESQKELVDRLLFLAVQQINSVQAGQQGGVSFEAQWKKANANDAITMPPGMHPGAGREHRVEQPSSGAVSFAVQAPGDGGADAGETGRRRIPTPPSNPNVEGTPRRAAAAVAGWDQAEGDEDMKRRRPPPPPFGLTSRSIGPTA